jgi:hypothetical protein
MCGVRIRAIKVRWSKGGKMDMISWQNRTYLGLSLALFLAVSELGAYGAVKPRHGGGGGGNRG